MITCLKDRTYVLMTVLLCKIHCPSFICFCKPSPHIYTAGPLKLEKSPHVPSTTVVSVDDDDNGRGDIIDHASGDGGESNDAKEENVVGSKEEEQQDSGGCLRSSLRKADSDSKEDQMMKKKVQWVDLMGKELAEIREFEPSEVEDTSYDGGRSCMCVIL